MKPSRDVWISGSAAKAACAVWIGMLALCASFSPPSHAQAPFAQTAASIAQASPSYSQAARRLAARDLAPLGGALPAEIEPGGSISNALDRFHGLRQQAASEMGPPSFSHRAFQPIQQEAVSAAIRQDPALAAFMQELRADARASLSVLRESNDLEQAIAEIDLAKAFRKAQSFERQQSSLPGAIAADPQASAPAILEALVSGRRYRSLPIGQAADLIAGKAFVSSIAQASDRDYFSAKIAALLDPQTASVWRSAIDQASPEPTSSASLGPNPISAFSAKIAQWRSWHSESPDEASPPLAPQASPRDAPTPAAARGLTPSP